MIDDKSLKKAFVYAAKHGGAGVWINGESGRVHFWSEVWAAATDAQNMRDHLRESMAAIVEMLGYLPNKPVKIVKGKGEWLEEPILPEVAEAELTVFEGDDGTEVFRLPLHWRGASLWQDEDGRLYGCRDTAPYCLCKTRYINMNGRLAAVDEDAGEGVYATAFTVESRTDDERREMEFLQGYRWGDWAKPAAAMEQMEVEEDE